MGEEISGYIFDKEVNAQKVSFKKTTGILQAHKKV